MARAAIRVRVVHLRLRWLCSAARGDDLRLPVSAAEGFARAHHASVLARPPGGVAGCYGTSVAIGGPKPSPKGKFCETDLVIFWGQDSMMRRRRLARALAQSLAETSTRQ